MTTQADKLSAKLEELAARASRGVQAQGDAIANANAKTQDINVRAQSELEMAGRTMREASERRMRARD